MAQRAGVCFACSEARVRFLVITVCLSSAGYGGPRFQRGKMKNLIPNKYSLGPGESSEAGDWPGM